MKRFVCHLVILALIACGLAISAQAESVTAKLAEKYAEAEFLMVEGDYDGAANLFDALGSYSDSSKMAMYCKAISVAENYGFFTVAIETFSKLGDFKDCKQMAIYYTGRYSEAAGDSFFDDIVICSDYELSQAKENYDSAKDIYMELLLFKDSMQRANTCQNKIEQIKAEQKKREDEKIESIYQEAFTLEKAQKWMEAIDTYRRVVGYKDTEERIILCNAAYKRSQYELGISLRDSKDWDAAVKAFENAEDYEGAEVQIQITRYEEGINKRAEKDWDGAVTALMQAGAYSDAAAQITETQYQQAIFLNESGKYTEAYTIFTSISGYKDVRSIINTDENIAREARLMPYKTIGSYVTFGTYPQTASGTDSTAIEWLVLDYDEENKRVLLISRYGLDAKPYNEKSENTTWEKCSLRIWLNSTFYNKAFSASEQFAILLTNVDNSKNQGEWGTNGSNNTQDRVFLLSCAEAKKYFGVYTTRRSEKKPRVKPTMYAVKQGAETFSSNKTSDGDAAGRWWLRSPGNGNFSSRNSTRYAASVSTDGSLGENKVNNASVSVRPVVWLNLNADIF